MGKKIKLPSGAELEITMAPFAVAKALYQACADEMRTLKLDMQADVDGNFWKDLFCAGVSSKKIEVALDKCLERCTYNSLKINGDTFEPEDARQDYLTVCYEVTRENVHPFMKSLFVQYAGIFQGLKSTLTSRSEKTISS